ncbi:type II toxin-antitoxin system RelE/ParE family toxin [Mycolicibacterium brumae]|uniref:type II toxin-antitoxin system RelE/ParE family toxin n=1 Tax=Mycolicibacterium brumae TaxID=85968 RepID=UPI0013A59186|nr:type II toxin-antitoxin system RelE/ParE family toxin [Mycolicibacterium brumae]MCV7191315.1 type II toxin-antitoxin system RelE/ParE family toxin [Mycolicibacterium brumae]UWW09586.1 type II toxin-antitoxin system RelE/ParE family toxin [Mycolicibacterium brumae]
MTFQLVVTSAAQADFVDAVDWYIAQVPEQALRLANDFDATIVKIRERPTAFRLVRGQARRAHLAVFPYQIWFRINDARGEVEVVALVHDRQDRGGFAARVT